MVRRHQIRRGLCPGLPGVSGRQKEMVMRLPTVGLIVILALGIYTAGTRPAGKVYRIGVLETTSTALNIPNLEAFRHGLRELGYVEGQNLVITYRSADGHPERFPALATELVRLPVDLIL